MTADAHELLARLVRAGHDVQVVGEKIIVKPPISGPVVDELRACKPTILEMFSRQTLALERIRDAADCAKTVRLDTPWGDVWVVSKAKPRSGRFEVSWAELADDPRAVLDRARVVLLAATIMDGKV